MSVPISPMLVLKQLFKCKFVTQAFKDTGKAPVETEVAIHRIRITLTSRNVKSLEKGMYTPLLLFGQKSYVQ